MPQTVTECNICHKDGSLVFDYLLGIHMCPECNDLLNPNLALLDY